MKLSAPIYTLKRLARDLSRKKGMPLHVALDQIANDEGFTRWSLLASRFASRNPCEEMLACLTPGDLILLGARPGQGKTLMGLELVVKSTQSGPRGWFFTLEWKLPDILERLSRMGEDASVIGTRLNFDDSDAINASYIIERLKQAPRGTVAVVDYLQLLDQKREKPELSRQVHALKTFAGLRGVILVFITQIDRAYDSTAKPLPGLEDVRLPNPLDLSLFNKTCFLNNGAVQVSTT